MPGLQAQGAAPSKLPHVLSSRPRSASGERTRPRVLATPNAFASRELPGIKMVSARALNPYARRMRSPILYRDAGFDIVWRNFATVAAIGLIFFTVELVRFRRTVAVS